MLVVAPLGVHTTRETAIPSPKTKMESAVMPKVANGEGLRAWLSRAICVAPCSIAIGSCSLRTVNMPCFRPFATSYQFIG